MNAIQLEFNLINESESDIKLSCMQKQIDEMKESMGKVRRKLFSQMGEIQKLCLSLKTENEDLRSQLKELKNEKAQWIYNEKDSLFAISI